MWGNLGYVIKVHKLICTPSKEFREMMAGGGAPLMSSSDSSQAHNYRRVIGPSKMLSTPTSARLSTLSPITSS